MKNLTASFALVLALGGAAHAEGELVQHVPARLVHSPVALTTPSGATRGCPRRMCVSTASKSESAWVLDVMGGEKSAAKAGAIYFLVRDLAYADGDEYFAVYSDQVERPSPLAAQLTLDKNDGYVKGHAYRVRIVQGSKKAERVLGEVDFGLD